MKSYMRAAKALWLFLIAVCLALLIGVFWFLQFSYEAIIEFAISQLHRPDLKDSLVNNYFTLQKFEQVGLLLKICGVGITLLILVIYLKRKALWYWFEELLATIKNGIQSFGKAIGETKLQTKMWLAFITLLVLLRSLWYASTYYAQYDECWNYNYFLSNSPLTTVVAYNNYPLHNLLTYFALTVFPDTTLAMRLPSIFFGIINLFLVFVLIKKLFGKESLALMAVAIYAVLPLTVFYMLYARGVSLALTCCLLLLHYFIVKKGKPWNRFDKILLVSIGVLGIYSMFTVAFFVSLLFAFSLWAGFRKGDWTLVKSDLLIYLSITILSLALYAPMLLGSGMAFATGSDYGFEKLHWSVMLDNVSFIARNQIGIYNGIYVFAILSLLLVFLSERKYLSILCFSLLILPFVIAFLFKVYLPARALSFMVFAYLLLIIQMLELIEKLFRRKVIILVTVCLVGFGSYLSHTHTFITWSAKPDKAAYELSKLLIEKDIHDIYDRSSHFNYFAPALNYYFSLSKKNFHYYTSNNNSQRFLSIDDYKGITFAESKKTYKAKSNDLLLYFYTDIDSSLSDPAKDIVIYQRPSRQDGAHKILQP